MPEGTTLVDVPWDDILGILKQRTLVLYIVLGILGLRFGVAPAISAWRRRT